jgi:2-dehydropantoate 2-reductase
VTVGAALQTGLSEADIAPIVSNYASMPEAMTSSMAHDLSVGKPLELFGLSGAIVRLGQEVGIATPTHQFIVQALGLHAGGSA